MFDIHDNIVSEGDVAYVLTTPSSGSRYKRLFRAVCVEDKSENKGLFKCFENARVVSVTSTSVLVPKE